MKDEKKVNKTEEAKKEENGTKLPDEQLEQVSGGYTDTVQFDSC